MIMKHLCEFEALGSYWWIEIEDNTDTLQDSDTLYKHNKPNKESDSQTLFTAIKQQIGEFERAYSRFIPTSSIGQLNTTKTLQIETQELYDILAYGFELERKTNGLFSPFVGSYLELRGYDSVLSFRKKTQRDAVNSAQPYPLPHIIEFTPTHISISENAYIDIGGYGKGWLVDKISDWLKQQGIARFVVNGGGDIYCYGYDEAEPKRFYLENPSLDGTYIGFIDVCTGAIASSSTNRRRWKDQNGAEHTHIVDLRKPLEVEKDHQIRDGGVATSHSQAQDKLSEDSTTTNVDAKPIVKPWSAYTSASCCLEADVMSTLLLIEPAFDSGRISRQPIEHIVVMEDGVYHMSQGYTGIMY